MPKQKLPDIHAHENNLFYSPTNYVSCSIHTPILPWTSAPWLTIVNIQTQPNAEDPIFVSKFNSSTQKNKQKPDPSFVNKCIVFLWINGGSDLVPRGRTGSGPQCTLSSHTSHSTQPRYYLPQYPANSVPLWLFGHTQWLVMNSLEIIILFGYITRHSLPLSLL